MAMKKAKKPMRGLDDFNRTMEGRDPKKRYPAYNVQPQKRKKSRRDPLEPLFNPKPSKAARGLGKKDKKPVGPPREKRPTFGAVPMPRKRVPNSVGPRPMPRRDFANPVPREMPKRAYGPSRVVPKKKGNASKRQRRMYK